MSEQKKNGYFVLTKNITAKQPYHFVLKAPNHETILSSENYVTSRSARNGITSVRTNSVSEKQFEIRTSKASEPYFVLKAKNGEIIGVSEMYSSMQACEHGIKAVMKYAAQASLVDETDSDGDTAATVTLHPQRSKSNKYA